MNRLLLIALTAAAPLAVTASGFKRGENLITPHELNEDQWDVLTKTEGSFRSVMWRSKEKGVEDMYVVSVHGGSRSKLKRLRELQDSPGKKSCESFQSIDLDPIPNKNYESVMWRTVCENAGGFKAQILQLAIRGKDSVYHLQKIWRGEIAESDLSDWIVTLRKVYVCDTRKRKKACPSGFEQVGGFGF